MQAVVYGLTIVVKLILSPQDVCRTSDNKKQFLLAP
jgi:hypothetical protein